MRIELSWRLDVRTDGRWTACGLFATSWEALRHGLAYLEISAGVYCLDDATLFRHARGSLRVTEGIAETREATA